MNNHIKNRQYYKFCLYGFLKNLRFFDAFFILFLIEKDLLFAQIGLLYAIREIVINVLEVPSGIFADKFGRKKSLVGSFVFYIASFLVFHFSNEFWPFLIAFVLFGVADSFRSGTHKGMIMDYLKINNWSEYKIDYYGHTRSWSQKGSAISSLLAGLLVFYSGQYGNIFLYSIVPYLINFLLIISYPKVLDKSFKQKKGDHKTSTELSLRSLFKIIKQPRVLKIINTSALHTAYLKSTKDYIQPLLVNVALIIPILSNTELEKKIGIIIGFIYFLIYLLSSKASKMAIFSNKFNKNKISYFTLQIGLIAGMICGFAYMNNWWMISLLGFVSIYLIENFRKPVLTGFVADNVPEEILASVISVQSLLKTITTAIIALVFGFLADKYGIGEAFLIISLSLTLLTLLTYALGYKKNHKME